MIWISDEWKEYEVLDDQNPDSCMTWQALSDYNEYLPERYRVATAEQAAAGHGGGDFFLVEDFINAIRTGESPIVDVYTACEWTAVGLLSELSVVNNGKTMDVPKFRKNMPIDEKGIKL